MQETNQNTQEKNTGGSKPVSGTKRLVMMAVLAALSIVFVAIIHFPIFPAAPFLEYDPADIPVLIGAFAFGPVAGICIAIVASIIQGFTVSAASGIYGIIMHIIATGVYVLVAACIYKKLKTKKGAALALVIGVICAVIVMAGANMVITPIFMGVPASAVKGMLLPVIIPFNLIKLGVNGIITFLVYKRCSILISKFGAK
ncbi:MAG: ECF transporter S component [Oscillospiraceae bacterium]|nr:ECF transporter S component [Oscillospiraceae bacterium]